jgi:hypothetical protein
VRVAATQERPDYRGCVEVRVLSDSAVFDNIDQEGLPIALDDLFDDRWLGEPVTVVGRVDAAYYPVRSPIRVPSEEYPPSGECRIWYADTAASDQPEPTDCEMDRRDVPEEAVLVDSDGLPVVDRCGLIAVDSFVIQLGDALRLAGTVDAEPTSDVIPVLPDADESLPDDEPIDVRLEPAPPGGNGSRILTTTGEPLLLEDVLVGDAVLVDGALVVDDPDFIRAALVLVDLDRLLERISTGEVADPTPEGFTLLAESNGCSSDAELEVVTDDATRFLRVTITEDGSTGELADGVAAGDRVSATGACQPEGLVADVVLIVVDER